MEIVFYLLGFFTLWALGVWVLERLSENDALPPPDRSVKRNIQISDEMDRLKAKRRKEA